MVKSQPGQTPRKHLAGIDGSMSKDGNDLKSLRAVRPPLWQELSEVTSEGCAEFMSYQG